MKLHLPFAKQSDKNKPFLASESKETETNAIFLSDDETFIRKAIELSPEKGYELLFRRYYCPLCSHAVRFLYSKELAEDIVSEVFVAFWQKKTYLQIQTSYRAYLFTSVRHQAFMYIRSELGKQKNMDIEDFKSQAELPTNPQQILQYNELYLKMEAVIKEISPQSQKVFMMSRFEGKKNPSIATELQISIKTVEGHITKVISILKKALQDGFLTGFVFWTLNS
jgi:RNA polymerase sigma-70 factor (ECF subfamily)